MKIILSFYIFIIISCAAIQSPSGGPKDEIPPEIIKIIPPDGTINFKKKKLEITFSEYIEESSLYNSIQLFPKPNNPITLILKNPNLIIKLNDSLLNDQTYIVSVNRNLTDERKVKITKGLQFAFSTGNKIDQGSIKGKVFYSKIASVELWKLSQNDSIKGFYERSPDYIVDASDSGDFSFNFLSEGNYKILAVDKSIAGLPIIDDNMMYGLSNFDFININKKDSIKQVKIKIPDNDEKIKMIKAEIISNEWGKFTFSKNIQNWEEFFSIIIKSDSLSLKSEYFKDPIDEHVLNFLLDNSEYDYIEIQALPKKNQSLMRIDSSKFKLNFNNQADTSFLSVLYPKKNHIHFIESDNIIPLEVVFSSLISNNFFKDSLVIKKDSLNIPINIKWNSYLSLSVTPETNWEENSLYELIIYKNFANPKYCKKLESVSYNIDFKTSKFKKFGAFLGNIDKPSNNIMIIKLTSFDNLEKKLQTYVNSSGLFKMPKVPEGDYFLEIFLDSDKNNKYTYGSLDPYIPSEWFQIYPDTIKIRANWDLEMKNIKVN